MPTRLARAAPIVASIALGLASAASTRDARAQVLDAGATSTNPIAQAGLQITGGLVTVYRTNRPFGTASTVDGTSGVNRAECESDAVFGFPLQLASGQSISGWDTIEFFVNTDGQSCGDISRREAADGTTAACYRVAKYYVGSSFNRVFYVPAYALIDAAQNFRQAPESAVIAYEYFNAATSAPTPVAASSVDGGTAYPSPQVSCLAPGVTDMQPTAFYVDVLAFNGESVDGDDSSGDPIVKSAYQTDNTVNASSSAPYIEYMVGSTYDLVGPPPPPAIVVGVGDTLLVANWSPIQTPSADSTGYQAYCFSAANVDGGAGGGGTPGVNYPDAASATADAGVDDADATVTTPIVDEDDADVEETTESDEDVGTTATTNPAYCPESVPSEVAPGALPAADLSQYYCGDRSLAAGGSMQINGLTDNTDYALYISGVDRYSNTGVFSNEACGMPIPTVDFYDTYRDDGGKAGGGYCDFGHQQGSLACGAALGLAGLVIGARRVRRGRRGRK